MTASANAPIPRFISIAPELDCTLLGDCNASYFPRLTVDSTGVQLSAGTSTGYIPIRNGGAGNLIWTASTTAAYLKLAPAQGVNNGTLRVDALTSGLAAGSYSAVITIDAGPLSGSRTVPVTLVVSGSVPSPAQPPAISSVGNSADGSLTAVVAGSLATVLDRASRENR